MGKNIIGKEYSTLLSDLKNRVATSRYRAAQRVNKELILLYHHIGTAIRESQEKYVWDAAKNFRNKYFFQPNNIEDPYTWTFDHKDHRHFILYKGIDIVGYAHVQLWPEMRAAIRIIVIDEEKREKNYGKEFIALIEKWLKLQGYKSVHTESSPAALGFYEHLGFIPMPFNDPDDYKGSPEDIAMGKML